MSYESAKGYRAEHDIEELLLSKGFTVTRLRAGKVADVGDIGGLPLVVSVKDRVRLALADWVDAANVMGERRNQLAVVWHKRRLKANPEQWYVTMDGHTFLELLRTYELGDK